MTKPVKINDDQEKEETLNLEDKDYALVRAIQDLTHVIKGLRNK
tara:strand:- start:1040 stop:1171 length:132 start_codon:yes stop_codon:yes gene_type:complete